MLKPTTTTAIPLIPIGKLGRCYYLTLDPLLWQHIAASVRKKGGDRMKKKTKSRPKKDNC